MTNALDFFAPKDLFESWPIFNSFMGDLQLIPKHFTDSPKVNVKETDKAYEIEIANPGFSKDDTKIEIENGVIYVNMELETETKDEEKYHVKQWSKSSYSESWNIPENVIEENITAKHVDGVLTITLPKKEETPKIENNPRTIKIE